MAASNLTVSANIEVAAREIDFATRFPRNWEHLLNIIGAMRPVSRAPGTKLTSKYAEVTLQDGNIGEGNAVPYSEATIKTKEYATLTVERYAKAVSIEAINEHGYDVAVRMTDEQFLYELQTNVTARFYDYIKTGTLISTESSFQMALAMAQGKVRNRWKEMHRGITNVVGFCNILDVYEYLGAANINNVENQFGLTYIKNFMGYGTLFLLSDNEIPKGMIVATPVENIVLYYVSPSESDFQKAGFNFRVDGVTNLIGVHIDVKYDTAESVTYALMGMTLFSEYLDGIAVITFGTNSTSIGTLTVTSEAGTNTGDTNITVSPAKGTGNLYKYKVGDSATTVIAGQNVQNWTAWDGTANITAATGKIITIVECGADYKAVKAGSATVTSKA